MCPAFVGVVDGYNVVLDGALEVVLDVVLDVVSGLSSCGDGGGGDPGTIGLSSLVVTLGTV
jgi:hypothetical protein